MHVQALGHVVLKVRDLHRSEGFYSSVLGMRIISRNSDPRMTFFTPRDTGDPSRLRPPRARSDCP